MMGVFWSFRSELNCGYSKYLDQSGTSVAFCMPVSEARSSGPTHPSSFATKDVCHNFYDDLAYFY